MRPRNYHLLILLGAVGIPGVLVIWSLTLAVMWLPNVWTFHPITNTIATFTFLCFWLVAIYLARSMFHAFLEDDRVSHPTFPVVRHSRDHRYRVVPSLV